MNVPLGDTYYVKFTTRSFSTGAPTTLSGTPIISVYEEANLTQITSGVTLTADYDSVTGLNDVAIVATSGNGYEAGKYYSVVITTGTVGGVSVVGEVVGHFRIMTAENVAGAPVADTSYISGTSQTANDNGADINAILADTSTDGVVISAAAIDAIWDEPMTAHTTTNTAGLFSILAGGAILDATVTGTPTSTSIDLSGGNTNNGFYDDCMCYIISGTGSLQAKPILASTYSGGTTTLTFDEAFTTTVGAGARAVIQFNHVHPKSQVSAQIMSDLDANGSTVIDAILTDTGTTIPGILGTPAGVDMSADIASIQTDTTAIVDDTNELQTDWTNGGRLDLIIDELTTQGDTNETKLDTLTTNLATVDTNVDAILVDTASIGITKNATFSNLEFLMVDATDHVTPETGLTVTGQMSIDGGAFAAVNGAIAEVGSGIYQIDLTAADTNGDVITYKFSSAGAADRFITVKTRA